MRFLDRPGFGHGERVGGRIFRHDPSNSGGSFAGGADWLDIADSLCDPDDDTAWVLAEWETVLADLARDPMSTRDRCDWAAKRFLLETFREAEGIGPVGGTDFA